MRFGFGKQNCAHWVKHTHILQCMYAYAQGILATGSCKLTCEATRASITIGEVMQSAKMALMLANRMTKSRDSWLALSIVGKAVLLHSVWSQDCICFALHCCFRTYTITTIIQNYCHHMHIVLLWRWATPFHAMYRYQPRRVQCKRLANFPWSGHNILMCASKDTWPTMHHQVHSSVGCLGSCSRSWGLTKTYALVFLRGLLS